MKLLATLLLVVSAAGCAGTKPSVFLPDALHVFYVHHEPETSGVIGDRLPIASQGSGFSLAGGMTWGWGQTQSGQEMIRSARMVERMTSLMATHAAAPPAGVSVVIENATSAVAETEVDVTAEADAGPDATEDPVDDPESPMPVVLMGLSLEVWSQIGMGFAALLAGIASWLKLRGRKKR